MLNYYLSHATFPFPGDRFLRPAFWVNFFSYCVAISFLKLMMVTSLWHQLTVVYMRLEKASKVKVTMADVI
jgi:hypothetical protein